MNTPGRVRPEVLDAALALAYVAVAGVELVWGPPVGRPVVAVLGTLALAVCVLVRRRAPVSALVVGLLALQAEASLDAVVQVAPYATLVCSYAVGRHGRADRARWGAGLVALGVAGFYAATGWSSVSEPISVLCAWLAAWALGFSTRRRLEEEQHAREALRERHVAEERSRIAGEMHDVVGHALNVLVVQAGAARLSMARDSAASHALLLQMEDTGRGALTELDHVLGAQDAPLVPVGLDQLPGMVERLAGSGLAVDLRLDVADRLPRLVDLAAHRIVQEALTNALKHAGPCRVVVEVRSAARVLAIDVRDDGRAAPGPPGRGLTSIGERARRCGGEVEHGASPGGGFVVRARLPIGPGAA
jgi:signal transduction histidine kinase